MIEAGNPSELLSGIKPLIYVADVRSAVHDTSSIGLAVAHAVSAAGRVDFSSRDVEAAIAHKACIFWMRIRR